MLAEKEIEINCTQTNASNNCHSSGMAFNTAPISRRNCLETDMEINNRSDRGNVVKRMTVTQGSPGSSIDR